MIFYGKLPESGQRSQESNLLIVTWITGMTIRSLKNRDGGTEPAEPESLQELQNRDNITNTEETGYIRPVL